MAEINLTQSEKAEVADAVALCTMGKDKDKSFGIGTIAGVAGGFAGFKVAEKVGESISVPHISQAGKLSGVLLDMGRALQSKTFAGVVAVGAAVLAGKIASNHVETPANHEKSLNDCTNEILDKLAVRERAKQKIDVAPQLKH